MPKKNLKIEKSKLLIVEGNDEYHFFSAFLKYLNIEDVQIISLNGVNKYKKEIEGLVNLVPGFDKVTHFAIIRDADNDYYGAFKSLISMISNINLPIPEKPGIFIYNNENNKIKKLKFGIYILPNNRDKGMLESLFLKANNNMEIMECVESFHYCIKKVKNLNISNIYKSKAQTLLSSFNKYAPSVGIAAEKNYWNFDSEILLDLKNFLIQFNNYHT